MDAYSLIDKHKMMYHPEWVDSWRKSLTRGWEYMKDVFPLYVEISPAGGCNHRCKFCAVDFIGYKPRFIDEDFFKKAILDMSFGGVKSIMFGGEGEPTLYPYLGEIIEYAKIHGIDVALTTNGSQMNKKFLEKSLKYISWIKLSIDAGTKETHLKIHRPKRKDEWEKIWKNIISAVELKRKNNYGCEIGGQFLLLPDNFNEVINFVKKIKETGADYCVIKPYSHQPLSITDEYRSISYDEDYSEIEKELDKLRDKDFDIIFRSSTMKKYSEKRNYDFCCATPYCWAYIMADGSVYSCSIYLGDEKFYLGNINIQSFSSIWRGELRKKQCEDMRNFDPKNCRQNCRMDEVNRYLWEVIHPPYNANFI